MTQIGENAAARAEAVPAGAGWWAALALVAFAVAQQCVGHQNADNSWLFTVAEKTLDGARPYVDVLETNPPASFILYMPAALIARATGLTTEFVVSAAMFIGAGLCLAVAARTLARAGLLPAGERAILPPAAVFALIVVPGFAFGEREHVALLWVLPMLAVHAARMNGVAPSARSLALAGALAGLAMAIKPFFALAIGLSVLGVAWRARSPRPLFAPENFWAAAVVILYTGAVYAFFPGFFLALPAIVDAYVPVRVHMPELLSEPWFLLNAALFAAALLIGGRECLAPRILPLLAASVGFAGAYFWQGKGWMNHELPAVSLDCLAIALLAAPMLVELARDGASSAWSKARPVLLYAALPAIVCAPVVFGAAFQWSGAEEHAGLMAATRRDAPPHPKIMALSPQLTAGFPLTRRVDGEWVGRAQRLWLTVSARMILDANIGDDAYRARLRGYIARDTGDFLADVRANKPDIILVDTDARITKAIEDIPALAAALEGYEPRETADDLVVWTRASRP